MQKYLLEEAWALRVPSDFVDRVLWEFHDDPLAGHPGCDETHREIQITG